MRTWLFYLTTFAVLTFVLWVHVHRVPAVLEQESYDAVGDRESWMLSINNFGADVAYQRFLMQNAQVDIGLQHVRAHVFGEALFETRGIDSIKTCDPSFGFGCFHGLFLFGFASQGPNFVTKADNLCVEQFGPLGTGCQHGIGHGIVEYVGRTSPDDALALCEQTTQVVPLLGCTSGVFMEFNTPFTILPGEAPPKPYPFSETEPYSVCNSVDQQYRESCYYELGGWWEVVLADDIKKMGDLCAQVEHSVYRRTCTLGIGNIIGPTRNFDVHASIQACELVPYSLQALCRAGAAWSMYSNPDHKIQAQRMCEGLSGSDFQVCTRYTDLTKYES